jgi:hypothetical protein
MTCPKFPEQQSNPGEKLSSETHCVDSGFLRTVKTKTADPSQAELVAPRSLQPGEPLPLLLQSTGTNVDLIAWAENNLEFIETELLKHGALLFRGFGVRSLTEFENFALTVCPRLFADYPDLPRPNVNSKIYEATPYPSEQTILFHNESSHMPHWPMKQWFFCVQPACQGGETPLADCRKVHNLVDPQLLELFLQKRIMYVRNFSATMNARWQDFFKTSDRSLVEEFCRNASIEFEWKENDGLRTRHVCPAVVEHPKTGEAVWFNQIEHWHLACLDRATRQALASLFREEDLPRNCYYGDGSPIEDCVIAQIGAAYRKAAVSFTWQRWDILMVDNMLTAHARNPYVGPRRILVAMGEMIGKQDVQHDDRRA